MKKKMYLTAEIISYVITFVYFVITACFFALASNFYWLFLVLGICSLLTGLALSNLKRLMPLQGKQKIAGYLVQIGSIISFPSCIFLLIAHFVEDKPAQNVQKGEKPKKEPVDLDKTPIYKRKAFYVALIALGGIFLAGFTGSWFETSGYTVDVKDFTLDKQMTENYNAAGLGSSITHGNSFVIKDPVLKYGVTMYKPKNATNAPVIFVMPGFTRTKATMSQYAIEFSRRGSVVFTLDPNCQGATTIPGYEYQYDEQGNVVSKEQYGYTEGANGLNYLIPFVINNTDDFPFIDRTKVGAIGHSAGGGNVAQVAETFNGTNYETSVIKALYISGYIKTSAANRYKNFHCNAAQSYAYFDEGAFRYQTTDTAVEAINLRFINEVNGTLKGYTTVDYDSPYGDMENGTLRIVHREKTNHCFEMYDSLSISNSIQFFRNTLKLDNSISDYQLVWFGKEGSNGISLICGFLFVLAIATLALEIPLFKSLKKNGQAAVAEINQDIAQREIDLVEMTPTVEKPVTKIPQKYKFSGKVIFWGTMILTAIIACLDYIPLARLTMDWLPDAANNIYTGLFPARMINAVMFWAVCNGIIGLLLFVGTAALENLIEKHAAKKEGREPQYDWSKLKAFKIKPLELLKSFIIAACMFGLFFFMVQVSYWLFHQDFRFMLLSASPLQPRFLVTWLMYIPLFFIFYISNSIRVNMAIGKKGYKEWQVYLIGLLANSLGLVFILIINYFAFFRTGQVYYGYWGNPAEEVWLFINMVFPLVVLMALLPILNRYLFKKTGNIYTGAMAICMIFVMMSLSASISYIPM